ncbi:MAG: VTT domain-containing protein [Alphaproteobacteria bacterium]|jgi:uncharacterized membrane protein YdjX (TVP38/TMEM64 family)
MRSLLADRRIWIALAIVLLLVAVRASGLADVLSLETLRAHRATLSTWVGANTTLAALTYVALYIAVAMTALPGAIWVTVAGGFLFGASLGTLLTVIGATIGACVVFFFAAKIFGADAIQRFGSAAAKLAENLRKDAASYLLVLRLVPVFPFFLVNLVPAFVGVKLPIFAITTFLGIIPGTFVFSLAGAGLGRVLDQGGEFSVAKVLTPEIWGGLIGLALLSLASIPIRRWLDRRSANPQ